MDSLRSEQRGDSVLVIHEVEEKETLFSISQRYRSSVQSIVDLNELGSNQIEVGQIIAILFDDKARKIDTVRAVEGFHLVIKGETLYSISKAYGIKLKDLRRLNELESNEISLGQLLRVSEEIAASNLEEEVVPVDTTTALAADKIDTLAGFSTHLVQTGETLLTIAREKKVRFDSIMKWNQLTSDYLRIGQKLLIKENELVEESLDSASLVTKLDDEGFERTYEVGIAAVISDISTKKYLALHRTLPIGTELKVRNLMNNLVVHVKVVGKLPNTGINRNLLLRLSQVAYDQLGILDPKSRVEVSHYRK